MIIAPLANANPICSRKNWSQRRCVLSAVAMVSLALPASAVSAADNLQAVSILLPPAVEIDLALSAAPEALRQGATVYIFGKGGFKQARAGSNGFTCLVNRDSFFYGWSALKPTCWDAAGQDSYVPVMLRVGELLAAGASAATIRSDIEAGFLAGKFHAPKRVGVAYMLAGDVEVNARGEVTRQVYPGHYMFYAPNLKPADLGFATGPNYTGPSLFSEGAGGKHLGYIIAGPPPSPGQ